MNKNRFFFVLFLATLVGFTSCKDDKKDDPEPKGKGLIEKEVEDINSSAWKEWVYFSFKKGEVVGKTPFLETKNDTDWDIAFCRSKVRLNGHKSGPGKGSALLVKGKIGKTGWDAIIEAPKTGYAVDSVRKVSSTMGGPKDTDLSYSSVITGAMDGNETWLQMKGMGKYTPTNQIFVVTDAKGNYVKLWLKEYANDQGKGGHLTIKYLLQTNGSRKFE